MASAYKVVSSDSEELILVDDNDNETGYLSKSQAHDGGGILHRAFSIFLFNDNGELLLQRRAAAKRLWPQFWSNSCCSHPRRGEDMGLATKRRLQDELNVHAELEFVYKFSYQAEFGALGSEHELCHVYLGRLDGEVQANDHEIDSVRYLSAAELDAEFERGSDQFTPWFQLEWEALRSDHAEKLLRYANT